VTNPRGWNHDLLPLSGNLVRDKILGGYIVRDANGQALVWIYSRESETAASGQAAALLPCLTTTATLRSNHASWIARFISSR
jgi:hypothetical protein